MNLPRAIAWFSCGAASAVATKLTLAENQNTIPVYCDTGSEHPDNRRFLLDCERWFGVPITVIRSERYSDTWDVWSKRRYLSGIDGALCTTELKVMPRLTFQRPDDVQVFGYTKDEKNRADRFRANYPEIHLRTPLIERDLDKAACLAIVQGAAIALPVLYALGFPNNNCLPCVKATSPRYWALVHKTFPDKFERMAKLSRELNVRLTRLKGERAFIDEIPLDHPVTDAIVPSCDFLCAAIEQELESAT